MQITIKANGNTIHIDGLAIRTLGSDLDYSQNACGTLTTSARRMSTIATYQDAANALKDAKTIGSATRRKVCTKCIAAAEAMMVSVAVIHEDDTEEIVQAESVEAARQLPGVVYAIETKF